MHTDQPLIHHADHKAQYCSRPYVALLGKQGVLISITRQGDLYKCALAERINGILKQKSNLIGVSDQL